MHFLSVIFRVDFKICLLVYKYINKEGIEYVKRIIIRQDTKSERRTRQDYDRTGLRTLPVEKLRYKCFRYAVAVV